jgi:leader peptidase (prepilin peptidase) / N-methyltransferase
VALPSGAPDGRSALRPPLPATAAFLGLYALLAAPFLFQEGLELELLLLSSVLALALAVLSAIDLITHRLPDLITLPLTALGLIATPLVLEASPWWQVASAGLGFALMAGVAFAYTKLRGRPGLGLGDAKLLAAAGAWLGAEALPSVLLWAAARRCWRCCFGLGARARSRPKRACPLGLFWRSGRGWCGCTGRSKPCGRRAPATRSPIARN